MKTLPLAVCLIPLSPAFAAGGNAPQEVKVLKDVSYLPANRPQKMDVYLPAGGGDRRPAVVVIHGGGWSGGSKDYAFPAEFAKRIAPAGYVVFCPDYQLSEWVGEGDAKHLTHKAGPQCVLDCFDAVSYVQAHAKEYHVDPARITLAGDSAGGQLALLTAYARKDRALAQGRQWPKVAPKVAAVIDFYGIADFTTFPAWGGWNFLNEDPKRPATEAERDQVYRRFSPVTYLDRSAPPTLIVHGRHDPIVPYSQTEELAARLASAHVPFRLVPIERETVHNFEFRPTEVDLKAVVLEFLHRYADKKSRP